jgi:predicted nucleic acid-binding protein
LIARPGRIALDNTVISSLQIAGHLARVLELFERTWLVPLQVRDEAIAWKAQGPYVRITLERLESRGLVEFATPEPGPEAALFAQLTRTRGQGESAAIAIAYHRGAAVATDDYQARQSCLGLIPAVLTLATEDVLSMAVREGLLSLDDAQAIWVATGIRDPRRGIRLR